MMQDEIKSRCPHMYDFQYSEGELDFMLQMSMLKDLKDRRLSTTLVPPSDPSIKYLGYYLTIIMVKQGVEVTINQNEKRIPKQCLLWKDYVFKFRDYGSNDLPKENFTPPSSIVSLTPPGNVSVPTQVATVDQWVKESSSGVLENPFSPPTVTNEYRGSVHESIVPPPVERPAPPARKRFAKLRKPMGVEVQVQVQAKDDSTESTAASSHEIPANAENDTVSHENLGSDCYDDARIHLKEGTASEDSSSRISGPKKRLQSLQPNKQRLDAPPIEPPFMPTETSGPTQSEYGGSDSSWEKQLVNTGRAGKLVDDSLPRSNVKDKIQSTDEVQTRQFRRTMNQRKSTPSAGNSRGSFVALLNEFESATSSILELARKSQGPVKIKVEIGRILINYLSGSSEFKKKPFEPSAWPRVFPSQPGRSKLESLFTNM